MNDMEEYLIELKKIYSKLHQIIIQTEGKSLSTSLLLYLMGQKSVNKRYFCLMDAAVDTAMINRDILDRLLHEGYVKLIDNKLKIILTVRGIWQVEQLNDGCNLDKLLSFIENKMFKPKETSNPLKDNEKLVLFVLLMIRSYSKDSSIYLNKKNQSYNEQLKQITHNLGDFLYSKNIINEKYKEDLSRTDTKLPAIMHFFRHTEKIRQKTDGLFIASDSNYYLNLYDNNADNLVSKLAILFSKVFEKSLSYDLIKVIFKKANETAYIQSIDMFEPSRHIFTTIEFEDIIDQGLRRALRIDS